MKVHFRKSFHRSLDLKGRLMLPPEYRDAVFSASSTGAFVLTGYDDCVVAYTLPDWEQLEETIYSIPNPGRAMRDFQRVVLGRAEELTLDAQSRVRVSQPLMRYAGLSRNIVLVGRGNKFEIWDAQRFENLKPDDAALEMSRNGIDLPL